MPNITDFLFGVTAGATAPVSGVWVRLTNNATAAAFVSSSATDSLGTFSVLGVPPGTYTVATGPAAVGPFTNTTDTGYFVGADVGAASNTFTGSVLVQGTIPWCDAKAFGAVGNGVADDTLPIQNAINSCQSAGGGIVFLPQGTYKTTAALQITSNVRVMLLSWGATLQPVANIDALFVSQNNGATSLGCEIYGLTINGQNNTGTVGVRVRDTDRCALRNVRIINCVTGIQIEQFAVGHWAEENSIEDVFIWNCTTGINVAGVSAGASLGEQHWFNVGISGCATGIALNNNIVFYRCRLFGITIWLNTNGVGLKLDCDVRDSVFVIDFENNNGTATNLTGVNVTSNALNLDRLQTHLAFTGTFATQVSDATPKGLVWTNGIHGLTTSTYGGIIQDWGLNTDAFPRVRMGPSFAGGGGIQFGLGSISPDVSLFRTALATLGMSGAFARSPQAPTFAASYTPDPTLGEVITMTLTNNITVNAPVNGAQKGVKIQFIWTQDGTGGRTITYNAIFHTGGGAALVTTLNTVTIDSFTFDGSVWRLTDRITGQA